ncbi:Glycosyltransferase, catalytic subunit of cellulose synthase and poly-beta-1,6-N-acetylglucosamine synthase [Daejeonella rubra]|uniref:Glycosyltransferase, catalytic subunit of cellulose synthase and poly-beta-1,6-N-acetylglucosamine synthase n=1 Tax=Daejeonella rubra TaxID=990371 RepID=A0A1G9VTY1_9SPHI|nr:glycosyltransferase [Daejeonella rubra]SDM75698.1 Glycosyltransferase, catalytic subunit of cellulose synthase and poly-beta-1,6-N-acetylglucosamine synthase [Daejeonella rubra]
MLHPIIIYIWTLIQIVIGYNLILPLIFFFFYLPIHLIKKKHTAFRSIPENDYAIIVTAYQQTSLIPEVIDSILKLNYGNFLVYIVADNCDISDLKFSDERVILLRPETIIASNTGSHFYAISHFKRDHKLLTIIDSDNLVHNDYLVELDYYFSLGFQAVQGYRKAKNLGSSYAALDAARDIYYHFYDGKILFGLQSSATLSGSGMAFTTELYKDCFKNTEIKGAGFDKALQYEIVKRGLRIAFAENAIVYDEKTSQPEQLVKQRSRWINSWFKYFSNGFKLIKKGIIHKNINQLLFGIVLLRPPLFIFLILSLICLIINIAIDPFTAFIWLIAFICFVWGFGISIVHKNTDPLIYRSLVNIPKFIFYQIISLLKIRSADKISVATEHSHKKKLDDLVN